MYENYLAHYGVLGMRWGRRKSINSSNNSLQSKINSTREILSNKKSFKYDYDEGEVSLTKKAQKAIDDLYPEISRTQKIYETNLSTHNKLYNKKFEDLEDKYYAFDNDGTPRLKYKDDSQYLKERTKLKNEEWKIRHKLYSDYTNSARRTLFGKQKDVSKYSEKDLHMIEAVIHNNYWKEFYDVMGWL